MVNKLPVRIYYEDTDAGGIVFYANYLRFAERGRTEYLRDIGCESSTLGKEDGLQFVVRKLEASYNASAYLDDYLIMETKVISMKNTSFVMKQSLFRDDVMIFDMDVLLVCVDQQSGRPAKLPDHVRTKMKPEEEHV